MASVLEALSLSHLGKKEEGRRIAQQTVERVLKRFPIDRAERILALGAQSLFYADAVEEAKAVLGEAKKVFHARRQLLRSAELQKSYESSPVARIIDSTEAALGESTGD
ncbi:MAG: hypothetical protein RMJ84_05530 [Sandaracinaceae bacterium]|nr:hypothetical protein [Sandaracinaceae bacterium]